MRRSKHVYFVRHGESAGNAAGITQGDTTPLSVFGEKQSALVARRLAMHAFERIVRSSHVRAEQTTAIIAKHLAAVPVEESALFIERRNPSVMLGTRRDDPKTKHIWETIGNNYHVPGWHHSDEENFEDLRGRAKAALRYLEGLPESRILVVSHGMFMKMIFAHILLGEHLDGRIFWDRFIPVKNSVNTGIMFLEYTERYDRNEMYWKLHSWNEHAHLLDDPVF